MDQIGYSLVDKDGHEVKFFGDRKGIIEPAPEVIALPDGDQVHCASVGDQLGDFRFVQRWMSDERPSPWHAVIGRTVAFDGVKVIVTINYEAVPSIIPPPAEILSQDLMAQFGADDAAKIQAAVSANVKFWLLWSTLQAQKDPMLVTSERFLIGWGALVQVLGQPRMDAIAAALDVKI
jgi:hypothetical protein